MTVLRFARVMLSFAVLLAPLASAQNALREKVGHETSAEFERTVTFQTDTDVAVRVKVAANPFDIEEVILMPDATGSVWLDFGEGPSSKSSRVDGLLEQLGVAPCAVAAHWERLGESWNFTLTLTADRGLITALSNSIDTNEKRWACRLRTTDLLEYPDLGETERLAGFVHLWSEVKFNFAFFDRRPELDWDRVLVDFLPRIQQAKSAPAYYRVLRECFALLHDGHTDVNGPSDQPRASPPVALGEIEGRVVVTGLVEPAEIANTALRREYEAAGLKIGDEVLAVDGESVAEVLAARIHPFISSSTPQHRSLIACPQLLRGDASTIVRLLVRTGVEDVREVSLTRGYLRARAKSLERANGEVEGGFFYFALESFSGASAADGFERVLPLIRRSKGLILDVRRNGGGNSSQGNRVISWLTDKPLAASRWRTRDYRPAFRAWGRKEGWHHGKHDDVRPQSDPWLGPVVVLTGPATFSAAEDFLVVLKASGRARLVGEPTAGSTGQPLVIDGLPAGGSARICTKRDTFPDGTEFVGIGVLPDVEVRPTIEDLMAGRDAVFLRGLEVLRALLEK